MAERNENLGNQDKTTPTTAQRTAEDRDTTGRQGTSQAGSKPGADQARERSDTARPASGRTDEEVVATEEDQDEQGGGEPRKQDGSSTGSIRRVDQSGLNTGEEDGDLDTKRTTTGADSKPADTSGNAGGLKTNASR